MPRPILIPKRVRDEAFSRFVASRVFAQREDLQAIADMKIEDHVKAVQSFGGKIVWPRRVRRVKSVRRRGMLIDRVNALFDITYQKVRHTHRWGIWIGKFRYCVDGYCPMGQYKSGRTFVARPERNVRRMK